MIQFNEFQVHSIILSIVVAIILNIALCYNRHSEIVIKFFVVIVIGLLVSVLITLITKVSILV